MRPLARCLSGYEPSVAISCHHPCSVMQLASATPRAKRAGAGAWRCDYRSVGLARTRSRKIWPLSHACPGAAERCAAHRRPVVCVAVDGPGSHGARRGVRPIYATTQGRSPERNHRRWNSLRLPAIRPRMAHTRRGLAPRKASRTHSPPASDLSARLGHRSEMAQAARVCLRLNARHGK